MTLTYTRKIIPLRKCKHCGGTRFKKSRLSGNWYCRKCNMKYGGK